MKRIFSIALLLIFSFSTAGVIVSKYTCNMQTSSCCSKRSNCCTHQIKLLKLKDDFVVVQVNIIKEIPATLVATIPLLQEDKVTFLRLHRGDDPLRPPPKTLQRLSFIQSFLI